MDRGDFEAAEDYLTSASAYVAPQTTGSTTSQIRVEASYLHLQLRLSQILALSVK